MRFNKILIVDSIPAGERNTARELFRDLELRSAIYAPAPQIAYERLENGLEFLSLLHRQAVHASDSGDVPVLHVECHGSDEGLSFADHSFVTWSELKAPLIDLNVATKMNLLIVVAACEGGAIVRTLDIEDRAPLHGFIGPSRIVTVDEVERAFLAFYDTLLRTRSANMSMTAMRDAVPGTFVYRSAEWLFQKVWGHYQATYETHEARLERGRRNVANPPPGFSADQVTAEQFAALLAGRNREFFDAYRRHFFLCDLFPDHEQRFTPLYQAPD